jgi:hypothetical protein
MTTPTVRLFRSTDTGAPSLSGTAGALIALLDACLKDGYNSKAVQSITRSGSTATVTFATAHGFAADGLTIVRIAGADQAEYNGDFQISNVTSTAFDITVSGTPATPATGTITAKVAPLDWEKAFSGTNKAVYRAPTGNRLYLRCDDNNPNADGNLVAFLRGYESMSSVDSGTGLFPTAAQMTNGIFLTKSTASDSAARGWILAGDGYEFHLFYAPHATTYANVYRQFHFGEPASELASDPFGCLIYGDYGIAPGFPQSNQLTNQISQSAGIGTVQAGHYLARSYAQTGAAIACGKFGDYTMSGAYEFGRGSIPYPAPHNNALYIGSIVIGEPTLPRAVLKSIYNPWHTTPLGHGNTTTDVSNLPGRTLYAVGTAYSGATKGETLIDITGPWR